MLTVRPLTPERWKDVEALFNARGCSVARQCWCMYYRRSGAPAANRAAQAAAADRAPPDVLRRRKGVLS